MLHVLTAIVLGGAVMSEAFGYTAEDLRKDCETAVNCIEDEASCKDVSRLTGCLAFIDGFRNGHYVGMVDGTKENLGREELNRKYGRMCVPNAASHAQLARIYLKYINDHPEELHDLAWAQLYLSWAFAFPCE